MIILPKQATTALELLESKGFEGFVVGGCVRDFLLKKTPEDIDITTNAKPNIVMEIFSNYKVIETGLKHGTVTVIIESLPIEITTYRIDGEYTDNRRPDKVAFTEDICEDLARRDFTMNAIAYNPAYGFIDPYGGKSDIEAKLIRAVGKADRRFKEDALRILRGIRFASTLGFEIETETFKAMDEHKDLLKTISFERIYSEFCKTLLGENLKPVFSKTAGIWGMIIPEILPMVGFSQNNYHHIYDVLTHTLVTVNATPPLIHLRLAAFFHDIGKPPTYSEDEKGVGHFYGHPEQSVLITADILHRLRCDNETSHKVLELIKYHDVQIECTEKCIKRWFGKLSPELFFDLLELKKADNLAQSPRYIGRQEELKKLQILTENIIVAGECFSLRDLKVNGRDFIELGYSGKEIGTALNLLLEKVVDGEIENNRVDLLKFLKNNRGRV